MFSVFFKTAKYPKIHQERPSPAPNQGKKTKKGLTEYIHIYVTDRRISVQKNFINSGAVSLRERERKRESKLM